MPNINGLISSFTLTILHGSLLFSQKGLSYVLWFLKHIQTDKGVGTAAQRNTLNVAHRTTYNQTNAKWVETEAHTNRQIVGTDLNTNGKRCGDRTTLK